MHRKPKKTASAGDRNTMKGQGPYPDIEISSIVTTGGTQSRVELSEQAVSDYADALKEGSEMPPIVVFHDGSAYWLADGFHRVMAANRVGQTWLPADVRQGTKRDAILHSVGSNATHGLPRTNADKRRAVTMLLEDEEWAQWSDREIAGRCSVHHSFVSRMRVSLSPSDSEPSAKTYTTKHGTTATMNTENIGRRHGFAGAKNEKTGQIATMAAEGFRAEQIAKKIGVDEKTVRLYARDGGIELPDIAIGKTKRLDHRRVIEQTVMSIESCAQSINAVPYSFDGISQEDAAEWLLSIVESMNILRKFQAQIKEAANG